MHIKYNIVNTKWKNNNYIDSLSKLNDIQLNLSEGSKLNENIWLGMYMFELFIRILS